MLSHLKRNLVPHCQFEEPLNRELESPPYERGIATIELALGFLSIAVFMALVWGILSVGHTHLRLCQAVREGARVAAISRENPRNAVSHSFGHPLDVNVSQEGKWVSVHASASSPGFMSWTGVRAQCTVTTFNEGSLGVEPDE